jgi:hypothetical protein
VDVPDLPQPGESAIAPPELDWLLVSLGLWFMITVPGVIAGWLGLFPKAGQPRWAALVPIYNIYILVVHVAGLSRLWFVLIMLPPMNVIASILVNVEVAKRFGRTETFGVGMSVFGFVLYPLLGFGRAEFDPQMQPFQPSPRARSHR